MNSTKTVLIIIGTFMCLTFALPIRRDVWIWQDTTFEPLCSFLFNPGILIAVFLMLAIAAVDSIKPLRWLKTITQLKVLLPFTYAFVALCIIFIALNIPGLWWTWQTVGVHFVSVTLVVLLLKNRLPTSTAFMLGCGFVFIVIGIWEIVYQCGLWFIVYASLGRGAEVCSARFWDLVGFNIPFIVAGIAICLAILTRRKSVLRLNVLVAVFAILTVGTITWWYLSGFWVALLWDWNTGTWYLTDLDVTSLCVYRSSKVWFSLCFVAACIPRRKQ